MSRQSLPRPEAVIFDIGNVLIEWQPEARYDEIIGPERRAAMFAAVDLHGMNEQLDRGSDFRAWRVDHRHDHPRGDDHGLCQRDRRR